MFVNRSEVNVDFMKLLIVIDFLLFCFQFLVYCNLLCEMIKYIFKVIEIMNLNKGCFI